MAIHRIRVTWNGSPVVGPGVSTFYQEAMADSSGLDALETFFSSLVALVPAGVSWNVPSSGDILNETDGTLAGSWSFPGAGGTVVSTAAASFANGVGARIKWRTNGIHGDRRVVGSTFIVPVIQNAFEGAGNLTSAAITNLQSASDALVAGMAGDMVIWSRPTSELAADGEANAVTAAVAPDLVSWLRSRRT